MMSVGVCIHLTVQTMCGGIYLELSVFHVVFKIGVLHLGDFVNYNNVMLSVFTRF